MRKCKKIEENILNLSFEVDTFEEEEGDDDIESSDSDNDDGDAGEFDPDLDSRGKNQDAGRVRVRAYSYRHNMSRGRAGETAGYGDDHDERRGENVMPSSTQSTVLYLHVQ